MRKRSFLISYLALMQGALFSGEKNIEPLNEKPISTIFYLVRHGQTDWNVQKKLQGQTDIPLNSTGREEAAKLNEKLHDISFDACFASDLQRACETAQILNATRGLTLTLDPRLRERNFGPWEGSLASEFTASLRQLNGEDPLLTIESDETILQRVMPCLNEIADSHLGSTILVVTHGGVIRSLLARLVPVNCSSIFDIQVKNTALLQLEISNGQYKIRQMEGIELISDDPAKKSLTKLGR
jgi:broad specificity phosphatase PhoE